ncbi:MAG: DEAD/DEAH box helicase, partial [Myxococcota bacterium]
MTTYRGLHLDPFQQRAIAAIDQGQSVLVSAPTGTGKTLIADYLVERIMEAGERIVYTAPIKALSNQKYREYVALHGEDKVGLVTGDIVIRRDAPLRIMTTEILRNILLQSPDTSPGYTEIGEIGAVILDELHFIDDPFRGTVWEEVLIYLPDTIQILGLSATLSNLKELAGWLSTIRSGPAGEVVTIRENKRAVPLTFHLANKELGVVPFGDFAQAHKRWRKEQRKNR